MQDPEVTAPADLADLIAYGRDYFWQVSADVGDTSVDSEKFRFRLILPPPAE